jgi:hypothetical protein
MPNIKKLVIWAAAAAVVYHFYKKAEEARLQALADSLDEDIFDPQD